MIKENIGIIVFTLVLFSAIFWFGCFMLNHRTEAVKNGVSTTIEEDDSYGTVKEVTMQNVARKESSRSDTMKIVAWTIVASIGIVVLGVIIVASLAAAVILSKKVKYSEGKGCVEFSVEQESNICQ